MRSNAGALCVSTRLHADTLPRSPHTGVYLYSVDAVPRVEILVNLPHIVKQVPNADSIRLIIKRIFIGFHGLSGIRRLSPTRVEGRHVTKRRRSVCLPTSLIIQQFILNVKFIFLTQAFSGLISRSLKAWALRPNARKDTENFVTLCSFYGKIPNCI